MPRNLDLDQQNRFFGIVCRTAVVCYCIIIKSAQQHTTQIKVTTLLVLEQKRPGLLFG